MDENAIHHKIYQGSKTLIRPGRSLHHYSLPYCGSCCHGDLSFSHTVHLLALSAEDNEMLAIMGKTTLLKEQAWSCLVLGVADLHL